MKVILRDEVKDRDSVRGWLRSAREYVVLSVVTRGSRRSYRIASDNGTPALFEAELFTLCDATDDPHWAVTKRGDGEVREPLEWSSVGFWEEYFDGNAEAVRRYQEVLTRMGVVTTLRLPKP